MPTTTDTKPKSTIIATYITVKRTVEGDMKAADIEQAFTTARKMKDQFKDHGTVEATVMIGKTRYGV